MSAAMFLIVAVWSLCAVPAGLLVLQDLNIVRAPHLRLGALILVLAFTGMCMRGQSWEWIGWLPMAVAAVLAYRFVRRASDKARTVRLLGRTVS